MSSTETVFLANLSRLQEVLAEFLRGRRWFGGKAQPIRSLDILDVVPLDATTTATFFLLVRIAYHEGQSDTYSIPVTQAADAASIPCAADGTPAAHLEVPTADSRQIFVYDGTANPAFLQSLFTAIRDKRRFRGAHGEIRAFNTTVLKKLTAEAAGKLTPKLMRAEQSNTSVVYGDRMVLKLFRRVEQGFNPDLEIGAFLTEKTSYRNVPPLAGYLEYHDDDDTRMSLAMLQGFVRNQGDAWEYTKRKVASYFEAVRPQAGNVPNMPSSSLTELAATSIPDQARELIGDYVGSAQLLGERTAELHVALSSGQGDPAFDPEPYARRDQQAFSERASALMQNNLRLLRRQQQGLPADVQPLAQQVLDKEPELEHRFHSFADRELSALRTRIHGDYHLGQVLVSGDDFVIIDFEGEPARPLAERRRKQSPLQDVAGMLRSFHYAAYAPLLGAATESDAAPLPVEIFRPWAYFWKTWVSAAFLHSYFATAQSALFLSRDVQESATILEAHLLEKAVYELGYELNNRPSWVRIPLSALVQFHSE
jgi:trehalose synthase-fused probable maltokinase